EALEQRTRAPRLSRRVQSALARLILEDVRNDRLTRVAHTILHTVDVQAPVQHLRVPAKIERAVVRIHAAGEDIGSPELPVCDRYLDAEVVRDAIARDYGWLLLGRFFESTVYEQVVCRTTREG